MQIDPHTHPMLTLLEFYFADMIASSFEQPQNIHQEQFRDLAFAYFGGVRITLLMLSQGCSVDSLVEAMQVYVVNLKNEINASRNATEDKTHTGQPSEATSESK